MRRSTPRAGLIAVVATACIAAGWPTAVRAASCYEVSAKATDICLSATGDADYAGQGALSPATAVFANGAAYFVIGSNSSVRSFDITNPMSPVTATRSGNPKWSFECEGNHTYLTRHMYVPATLDDFPYAFVPMSHWGWDWFSLSASGGFLGTGLKPSGALQTGFKYTPVLFRHGTSVYLVGYQLDPTALAANDMTVYMYKVADASGLSPQTLTTQAMATNRVALPTGTLNFGTSGAKINFAIDEIETSGGTRRLLVARAGSAGAIVDLTNPSLPARVATLSGGDSRLWEGNWILDGPHSRIMVSASSAALHFFDIFDPAAPEFLYTVQLATVTSRTKYIAAAGELAVVGEGETLDYLNLGATPPVVLPAEAGVNTLTRICAFESYGGDVVFEVGAFVKDGAHYAVRALFASSDFVKISNQCISSEPEPYLSVTPPAGTTADCGGGINGFPGDVFTLADTSGGEYNTAFFHIEKSGQFVADKIIEPHGQTTWTPTEAGTYTVDIVIGVTGGPSYNSADYGRTKTVVVCNNEEAVAAVTQVGGVTCPGGSCDTWLQGQQLTVSGAGSEGHPTGYDWFVLPPTGSTYAQLFTTVAPQFTLAETGNYHVFLVAHYNHTPPVTGDDKADCASFNDQFVQQWLSEKTTLAAAELYDSCAYLGPLPSQPFSLGEVAATQGGVERDPFLAGAVINLQAPYAISGGWTPTFAWSIKNSGGSEVYAPAVDTGTAGLVKGSIPANQLGTGTYTVALHGSSANGDAIGPAYDRSASINVAVCAVPGQAPLVGPSQEAQQAAGNITFTWKVPSGTGPFDFEVWNADLLNSPLGGLGKLCTVGGITSAQGTEVSCVASVTATTDWLVRSINACATGGVDSQTWTVTISSGGGGGGGGGGGTCTAQPTISSVSVSPSQPKVGEKLTLTANGANLTTATVSWKVTLTVLGNEVTVASASGNPATINGGIDTAGSYTVTATALSAGCTTATRSVPLNVSEGTTCTPPTVANVTVAPSTPAANQPATFTATVAGATASTTYAWTFKTSGGLPIAVGSANGNPTQFTFTSAGTYTAELVASTDGCASPAFSKTVTVTDQCDKPTAPVAAFTFSPASPHVGEAVQFTDSSVNGATSWSWRFGDGPSSASSEQNPTHTYQATGTYTVSLEATNCKGSNTITAQLTVLPPCSETVVPTASIDWQEKGTFEFHGQVYNQPYVGQTIHLLGSGTNNPSSYNWYDFGDGSPASTKQNPTHVWTTPGLKNLRMRAKNCFGESQEAGAQIQIYSDSRPVMPTFQISDGGAQGMEPGGAGEPSDAFSTGTQLTFTAATGYDAGDPSKFVWDFGDGSEPVEGNPVTHTYECRGVFTVTLSAGRYKTPGDVTSPVVWGTATGTAQIDGELCGPEAVIAAGAAKVPGFNGTSWRTDMHIFNASESSTEIHLGILPAGQSNPNPFEFGPYTLAPKATLVLRDILGVFNSLPGVTTDYTKAAIRVMYANDQDEPPVVMQRTYTDVVGGGTYGQFIPGVQVLKQPSPSTIWLTGLRNTGLETGFRTNVGLTHLKGDIGDVKGIHLSLLSASGAVAATKSVDLAPYGFLQESLVNLFGPPAEQIGAASLKIDLPAGAQVLAYYSEVDNLTGDPFLVTGDDSPSGKILIPGVARLAGEAGTLWRSDIQLTNADDEAHTWELKFLPKGDIPVVAKTLPLEPGQSVLIEDAVQWIYQPFDAPDASGVVCVLPLEDNDAMPAVSARTYNLTPSGTYGQFIQPLDAGRGATAGSSFSRMYLTGMSTEDVARTNLGFVNIGTSTVNFDVYLYDRDGDLLNPNGAPYTFALGVNGWDQDKLENRFRNFFGEDLPANQEAISAVIVVKNGGPGFAYASVIDPVTGDPMLVPAQLAP